MKISLSKVRLRGEKQAINSVEAAREALAVSQKQRKIIKVKRINAIESTKMEKTPRMERDSRFEF